MAIYSIFNVLQCEVTLSNTDGNTYSIDGVDSITITDNVTTTVVYPKNRKGDGIFQSTGGEQGDTIEVNFSYLSLDVSDLIQSIPQNPYKTTWELTIADNVDPLRRVVLRSAMPNSDIFQQTIDDQGATKYNITFSGKLTEKRLFNSTVGN